MTASLRISPTAYRMHLEHPSFLPTLLRRTSQVVTDETVECTILEGQHPFLVSEIEFELWHPAQRPLGGQLDWQLSGCATTALIALRLMYDATQTRLIQAVS